MARTLLGGIAIAAGTGLVIGLGSSLYRSRADARRRQPANLEPLIERLDDIEARVAQVERCLAPQLSGKLSAEIAAVQPSLVSIDEPLAAQSRDIELLRIRAAACAPEPALPAAPELAPEPVFFELPFVREAVDHGLPPRAGLVIEKDPDLKSLHGDRSFDALVARAKKCAAA